MSSSSLFRGDAEQFISYAEFTRSGAGADQPTEPRLTHRLQELLPGPLFPDEVCFRSRSVFMNYSSRSRADEALLTLHRVISFDSTSPVDQVLRMAKPSMETRSPTNGHHTLFFFNVERLSMEVVRATVKRLLGGDNLLLPINIRPVPTAKGESVFVDFHNREALERAREIFRGIPANTSDPPARALHRVEIANQTVTAYALAARSRGGDAAAAATSAQQRRSRTFRCKLCRDELDERDFPSSELEHHRDAPRCKLCLRQREEEKRRRGEEEGGQQWRTFRCELCRDELDEREFPSSELERHRDNPRCRSCCERREEEKRREWEETEGRRRDAPVSAPAGGGAAAASSSAVHPCLAQSPTGRCTLPSPCRFGMVRSDRCLMWLVGACGQSGDHDGLSHSLTPMEQQLIAAVQQVQQQQQQPPPQLQPIFQQPQQQQPQGFNQVAQVAPGALPPAQQQPEYQQQERAGQRRGRENHSDDGFGAKRHGRY